VLLKDHYATLGIAPAATAADVKKAYRTLALKYHPDRSHTASVTGEARFREVQEAYDVLSNTASRARYDEERWLAGMDKRSKSAVPNTPDGIRKEIISVCQSLDGLDTHRIDRQVLSAYFLHLLRPARMEVLIGESTPADRTMIISALLTRIRLLPPEAYAEMHALLEKLASDDTELHAVIRTNAQRYYATHRYRRWEPYLLALIAVIVCLLMALYSRHS
jgi:hypothetical protein